MPEDVQQLRRRVKELEKLLETQPLDDPLATPGTAGTGGGLSQHGNEYHTPDMALAGHAHDLSAYQPISEKGAASGYGSLNASVRLIEKIERIYSGLDAAKPGSPTVGDAYVATDTAKLYLCYSAGVWTAITGGSGSVGPMGPPGFDGLDGESPLPLLSGLAGPTQLLSSLSTQTLVAASAIVVSDGTPVTPIQSASAITLISQPTITAGRNGQIAYVVNVGSYNIILQDVNALGGSLLRLTANTVTIQPGGTLKVRYDSTIGFWMETAILNPQAFTPSISGFTIDGSSADTREVAAAATADAMPSFVLTYVGTPSACSIDIDAGGGEIVGSDYPIAVPSPFLLLNSGTTPPSKAFYRGTSIGQVRTFTATATVAGTGGLTRQCTVTYINRRYMGPSVETATLTTAQVLGLDGAGGTSGLSTIRTGTFSVTIGAGEYLWYAYRAALGAALYLTLNGEIAEFIEKQTALSHTNDYGFAEDFRTWRATIANVGAVTAVVATSPGTNRFYMGPAANGTDTILNAEILALDDTADGESGLYSSQARTWTDIKIEAGEYLWYCHPSRVADLATIKDVSTGFAIAGSYRNNVTHANQYGYQETYRCWRSDNPNIFPTGGNVIVT